MGTDPVSQSSLTSPVMVDKCSVLSGPQYPPPWNGASMATMAEPPGGMKRGVTGVQCWVPREHCRGHHLKHDSSFQCLSAKRRH